MVDIARIDTEIHLGPDIDIGLGELRHPDAERPARFTAHAHLDRVFRIKVQGHDELAVAAKVLRPDHVDTVDLDAGIDDTVVLEHQLRRAVDGPEGFRIVRRCASLALVELRPEAGQIRLVCRSGGRQREEPQQQRGSRCSETDRRTGVDSTYLIHKRIL